MDEESRAKRTAALEEKKRRLEELKRRRQKNAAASAAQNAKPTSISTAAGAGNLDEYIDGLLNNPSPAGSSMFASPTKTVAAGTDSATPAASPVVVISTSAASTTSSTPVVSTSTAQNATTLQTTSSTPSSATPIIPTKTVETFTAGTQTEEDDFPPELESSDTDSKNDDTSTSQNDTNNEQTSDESKQTSKDMEQKKVLQVLSAEEKENTFSSDPFSSFFVNASKKVERLLGAPTLADLLVDVDYDNRNNLRGSDDDEGKIMDGNADDANEKKKQGNDASYYGLVSGRATYECSQWTHARNITCMDWSPTHKELIVTGYHMPGSSINYNTPTNAVTTNAAVSSSSSPRRNVPSATVVPKPGETQQADGLALVWSLAMTNRPEHIFTCGSPLLCSKFHPTEPHLLVGGSHSGQLVVWDMRMGRLPVQRSSLSTVANKIKGHSHPVCALEVAEGGSGLVTADTMGKVKFWSLANLRDPAESISLTGAHISSLAVAPETNSIIVGDETGCIHTIIAQNINSASAAATGPSAGRSSSSRRAVKKVNGGHSDNDGHFGMITGISTKVLPRQFGSHHHSVARGFLRGSTGLVLTCGVDWTTKLWAPAYKDEPILSFFSPSYDYMADVQWSPTNPSIFATASCKGTLGLWNLASDLDEPLTGSEGIPIEIDTDSSSFASRGGLNKLKWSADGRRIAVASADRLHVLGMTDEVSKPKADDETTMINNLTSRGFLDEQ